MDVGRNEFDELKNQFREMSGKLNTMSEAIVRLNENVSGLTDYLKLAVHSQKENQEVLHRKIDEQLDDHEVRLKSLEKSVYKFIGASILAGSIAGTLAGVILRFVSGS